jgi:hypothetical protein
MSPFRLRGEIAVEVGSYRDLRFDDSGQNIDFVDLVRPRRPRDFLNPIDATSIRSLA